MNKDLTVQRPNPQKIETFDYSGEYSKSIENINLFHSNLIICNFIIGEK